MEEEIDPVARAFAHEVPEIADGRVKIKAVARIPGVRSKVAVACDDANLDYIGACVGPRGHRIKNIVDSLNGERIDLVKWSDSPEVLIANALQPASIEIVVLFPAERLAKVVVKPDEALIVLGRRGEEHLQLASRLSGWAIEVEML